MNMNERWMYPTRKWQVFVCGELVGFYDSLNDAEAKCEQVLSSHFSAQFEILSVSELFLREFYPEELDDQSFVDKSSVADRMGVSHV